MSLYKLMRDVERGNFEYRNGRIRYLPAGYMKQGAYPKAERADLERFGEIPAWSIKEQNGIAFQMVGVKSVFCPYPDMHKDVYVSDDGVRDGQAMVAASVCQKCEHRIKAERRGKLRFPRCARAIEDRANEKLESSLDLLDKASKEVSRMMGGG